MAIILLTMMNRFMGQTAETSQIMTVAREASVILRMMKMAVREAEAVEVGENILRCTKGGKQAHFFRFDNVQQSVEYTNAEGKKKHYARGDIVGLVSSVLPDARNIFSLTISFKDPRVKRGGAEEAISEFSAIVTQRVNEKFSDPAWILNKTEGCPPSCGS
jgi:hypothetical protein